MRSGDPSGDPGVVGSCVCTHDRPDQQRHHRWPALRLHRNRHLVFQWKIMTAHKEAQAISPEPSLGIELWRGARLCATYVVRHQGQRDRCAGQRRQRHLHLFVPARLLQARQRGEVRREAPAEHILLVAAHPEEVPATHKRPLRTTWGMILSVMRTGGGLTRGRRS